ncbi:5-amino-6-(5-phosphoribosylamino)uracil reductase [Enterococcus saigonensis]|uniref:5-amino-6-(5-phosphoribosylamino)uracil reductase n=1 Tax=Enterococcus saigonensis TaxID=1805431 RepID=A0A679IKY5_9ENTE|nr:dihydrofolate reductase family protein [Enterococcus saigonensis]BCA85926.1 5-amino-6-(5-phosphoribosylamino)uracil reductase [Enterococcus saigonensis]
MVKPFVTCHILSALDGKISGDYFKSSLAQHASEKYGEIRKNLSADAWLFGTTTVKEFLNNRKSYLDDKVPVVSEEDFVAKNSLNFYFVSVDTVGELGWSSGIYRKEGRPDAHIIVILLESTSNEYKAFLRKIGISYITAGKSKLDCNLALEKLNQLFNIKKLLICGGGQINWTFLEQNTIDQLSVVLAPVSDGRIDTPSIFEQSNQYTSRPTIKEFEFENLNVLGEGAVLLNYKVINE